MKKLLLFTCLSALVLSFGSGCASVVTAFTGRPRIHLNSNPSGATVTITGENGTMIVTNTPAVVRLGRARGYFAGAHYGVKFEMAGYSSYETSIYPRINPWYFGNIAIGGVIGIAAVDPLTGAMWSLHPHTIDANLVPKSANLTPEQQNAMVAAATALQKSGRAAPPKESPN